MMKKNRKRRSYLLLMILAVIVMGCGQRQKAGESARQPDEVVIPVVFTVDPTTGNKNNKELADAFNETYQGIYRLEVEWVLETEEEYRKNLKRQNVTDELPAVITDLRMLPSFYQMMIEDERIVDLKPYIEADSEWLAAIEPEVLAGCTEADGSIYLSTTGTSCFSCSGVFWNETLFQEAGIYEFPGTWEEFWQCCDQLAAAGITPLALHTEGTAWAPMLFATAQLASAESGLSFMKETFPESFQNENGIQLANTLKRLFQYTTENAVHNDFDVSYNNFFTGKAAMIPNGHWMIGQMPVEWEETVRFSAFPENAVVSSPETFGWAVVAGYSDEVKEGAIEFLKFRTLYMQAEKEAFLAGSESDSQVVSDYIKVLTGDPRIVPNYQIKWNSIFQETTLGECLPLLIAGEQSPEEFVAEADKSIRQYEEER